MTTKLPRLIREANLPSPSPTLNHLFEMLFSKDTAIDDLAEVIALDAGLTVRILHCANAAFSSPVSKIGSVKDAIVRLGMHTTIQIITATEVAAVFFSVPGEYGDMQHHWEHNLLVGCLSEAYAMHFELPNPGYWFIGGLLHDIGRLLLITSDPITYADIVKTVKGDGGDIRQAEKANFEYSHDTIGGLLLDFWQFPSAFADAAYHHHRDFCAVGDICSGVGVANAISHALQGDNEPLPEYSGIPVIQIVDAASERFDIMKKMSGMG